MDTDAQCKHGREYNISNKKCGITQEGHSRYNLQTWKRTLTKWSKPEKWCFFQALNLRKLPL